MQTHHQQTCSLLDINMIEDDELFFEQLPRLPFISYFTIVTVIFVFHLDSIGFSIEDFRSS